MKSDRFDNPRSVAGASTMRGLHLLGLLTLLVLLQGCRQAQSTSWQGYVEGEYVHVASPLGGRLLELKTEKGSQVSAGTKLFVLEHTIELAGRDEALARVKQADARLADLQKGQRPSELDALEARLAQARTSTELTGLERTRAERLHQSKVLNDEGFDRARLAHESNLKLVAELEAQLATAKLGARPDQIQTAAEEITAARAALARADWSLQQKSQSAPGDAFVHDTLYREGEFVAPGNPVVSLLPPGNIKIRFFVPEAAFSTLKIGDTVRVSINGRKDPVEARVSYLSSQPEYTPPVLYNRENRSKLVFMAEARPTSINIAKELHPGQPVDVHTP